MPIPPTTVRYRGKHVLAELVGGVPAQRPVFMKVGSNPGWYLSVFEAHALADELLRAAEAISTAPAPDYESDPRQPTLPGVRDARKA